MYSKHHLEGRWIIINILELSASQYNKSNSTEIVKYSKDHPERRWIIINILVLSASQYYKGKSAEIIK